MFTEKDSEGKLESDQNSSNPDHKIDFPDKGIDFLRKSDMGRDGFLSKPSKFGYLGASQELTLSYLCDGNSQLNKGVSGKVVLNSIEMSNNHKGKGVDLGENLNQEDRWVERDFLQMNETRANSSKREVEEDGEFERVIREKKPKLETLNLSLSLPDVSLSLTASNAVQNADHPAPIRPKPSRSVQSLAPSNDNTQMTCSNDFTAASLSCSFSHQFSHNPSCSMTRNSTENYDYSFGRETDQILNCGEGTNGSVHSRFKPIGEGISLSNHGGGGGIFSLIQGSRRINMESCNDSLLNSRAASSDNLSFFPSELPAKVENSRGGGSENVRSVDNLNVGGSRGRKLSTPERIVREIVSESITCMSQTIQELPNEMIELTKEYLKNVIAENKEELSTLQNRLERRSDLNYETLSRANKNQLDIMVTVKTGLGSFLSGKPRLSPSELVEVYLLIRCRNVNCKSLLPVDDCDCKICSANKGFCSSCMCPICMNFDCANNTCSWVGCDVCSHWCHAACGINENLIKPGPSLKGHEGTTEMQYHCLGCGHASEMFGFVKDVFVCCSKDWGLKTLMKELDCVRKLFQDSDDFKGKQLHIKAGEMFAKLDAKMISPLEAHNFIIHFFNYTDGMADFPSPDKSSKSLIIPQPNHTKAAPSHPKPNLPHPKYSVYNMSSSTLQPQQDPHQNALKTSLTRTLKQDDEFRFGKSPQKDGFDNLESIVRIKEAEARMFQGRADEARREAEGYIRMIRARNEKFEEEYAEKLSKLCLQQTEDRRRKKLEELKIFENSQSDYYKMKMRMQAEIAGLLERMESTKKQWV